MYITYFFIPQLSAAPISSGSCNQQLRNTSARVKFLASIFPYFSQDKSSPTYILHCSFKAWLTPQCGSESFSPYILHRRWGRNNLAREMLPDSKLKNEAEYPWLLHHPAKISYLVCSLKHE